VWSFYNLTPPNSILLFNCHILLSNNIISSADFSFGPMYDNTQTCRGIKCVTFLKHYTRTGFYCVPEVELQYIHRNRESKQYAAKEDQFNPKERDESEMVTIN
jgi:hypothetical protein